MNALNKIDHLAMLASFNDAAEYYEDVALIQHEIGERLLERLADIKITPHTIVDLGCGTGYCTRKLAERFPTAEIIGIDLADQMVKVAADKSANIRFQCDDAQQTSLADHSVDLIFSNLLFQWCDIQRIFAECNRLLKPNGLLIFTSLGPDTLYELREAWKTVDKHIHVNQFIDMHHVGDALLKQHFIDPVVEAEHLTATFSDLMELMYSLKAVGAHNVNTLRAQGLMGKHKFQQMMNHYETFRNEDDKLPATYEVIYGHAWQPDFTTQQSKDEHGNVHVPLKILRK